MSYRDLPPLDEITPERRDAIIERAAQWLCRAGLGAPAILFIEGNKPFSRIAGNALHLFSPILGVFVPDVDRYGYLLRDPENVEILVHRLQELEEERARQQRLLREERRARARERRLRLEQDRPEVGGEAAPAGGTGTAPGDHDGPGGREST
ncbi:MAG: hypothetical protein K6U08_10245 [Firmicutes bacterium]|nr:hypothetical protein [Bacillota bacterium]